MKNPYKKSKRMVVSSHVFSFDVIDWTEDLDPEKAADRLLGSANDGDRRALAWVMRFTNYGVTSSMLDQIGAKFRQLEFMARLYRVPGAMTFEWRLRLPDKSQLTDDVFLHLLALLIIRGRIATRIKKCEFDECERPYFLGNAKAKYCSDKCGSNVRARKMRRNQKARESL